jgi:hypothetical protein
MEIKYPARRVKGIFKEMGNYKFSMGKVPKPANLKFSPVVVRWVSLVEILINCTNREGKRLH